jgi:hypothetical protein
MDLEHKYQAKREELLVALCDQRQQLFSEIAEKETGIIDAKRKANEYGQFHDRESSHRHMNRAAQLTAEVRAAKIKLKEIDPELDRVNSGKHPELAALSEVCRTAMIAANLAELEEAKAAFQSFLTSELKAAAQRFVMASKNYDPLSAAPALAQMIAGVA